MVDQHIFFHPDCTVGPGVSPDLLTLLRCRRSRAFTAGGESHPALKTYALLVLIIQSVSRAEGG